jgi:prepilin-type N-terminal cleavage/methylation domain-containing protein/prepilin-type processing-associated H-X9-DG protein
MQTNLFSNPAAKRSVRGVTFSSRQKSGRRAFTLIELLAVIAIIAILASLLIPTLTSVRAKARAAACVSNVRQIALAGYLYGQDHGVYPGWSAGVDRKELLFPYLHTGRSNTDTGPDQVWHCPSNERIHEEASYGWNVNLNWVAFDQIRQPSATVAVADAGITDSLRPTLATHLMPPSWTTTSNVGRPNPRHDSAGRPAVSVAFVDGHARAVVIAPPFYPDVPGSWFGNGVTDPENPAYKDEVWDLH